ncbi:MAG: T9SS type A sorting domain-containing protein [Bacteroidales bacterium]|nr:T9SS type A sorting domain-containing protein [Bacteroidales bacterium]MDD3664762.1 T9SS type A sorting domain-containing protein [Bacteroidales bacterium]
MKNTIRFLLVIFTLMVSLTSMAQPGNPGGTGLDPTGTGGTPVGGPLAYTVTGGGAYCIGGAGVEVTLSGSQSGVTYTLHKNNVAQTPTVAGTGSSISFGLQTVGTYTVKGYNGTVTTVMTGSVSVTTDPLSVGGGVSPASTGPLPSGSTSGLLTLSGQTGDVQRWQSSVNSGIDWIDIANTNTTYTSGALTQTTWFRAIVKNGTCSEAFSTHAVVTILAVPGPVAYNVTGGGSYCTGGAGVAVGLDDSEIGVTYTLFKNTIAQVPTVAGTGNAISFGAQTAGTYTVSGTNSSGTTTMTGNAVVVANPLPVPTISGDNNVCAGETNVVYSTEAGMAGYIWTISAGGTITAGSGTNSIMVTWSTAGNQSVSVNYTNSNSCTAVSPTTYNVTVNALPVPGITGPTSVCVNSTGNVYQTESGMTGYTWTYSMGGVQTNISPSGDAITITWLSEGPKTVTATYANSLGCNAATPTSYPVTVNALPVPTITGPSSVCAGSTVSVYQTQSGMTGYTWTVSAGGTITAGAGTNSITVTWNTTGAQSVSVNYANSSGCSASAPVSYPVTVNALPVPTVTGPSSVCVNSTGNVYQTQSGMTAYNWSVSAGGTITAGAGTNSITVTWNTTGAQSVSVNYTNSSGCSASTATSYPVAVNALPVPVITGPANVCAGSSGNVYTTQSSMTGYNWTVSTGGTITAGAGTSAVTVTWNTTGNQTVSVNYTNAGGCSAPTPSVYNVAVGNPSQPTITGDTEVCINSGLYAYTTEGGMTGYNWVVTSGGTITSGQGTNQLIVHWSTPGAQSVSVNYNPVTGCPAPSPTVLPVMVTGFPGAAGSISGTPVVCAGTSGVQYSVSPIAGAIEYLWTVPSGATIVSGNYTNQIVVDYGTSATSGTMTVKGANVCGNGAVSPAYPVTVNGLPSAAGVVTGATQVCAGSTGVVYSVNPVSNATSYSWSVPAGASVVGGANTNTITVDWSTAGGNLSVQGVNGCGNGAASPNLAVQVSPVPATPVIELAGTNTLVSSSAVGNQWYLDGVAITGAVYQTYTPVVNGVYHVVVTVNGCSSLPSNTLMTYVGVDEQAGVMNCSLYPVPSTGVVTVNVEGGTTGDYTLQVRNAIGLPVWNNTYQGGTSLREVINLSGLPSGIYSLEIKNGNYSLIKRMVLSK